MHFLVKKCLSSFLSSHPPELYFVQNAQYRDEPLQIYHKKRMAISHAYVILLKLNSKFTFVNVIFVKDKKTRACNFRRFNH